MYRSTRTARPSSSARDGTLAQRRWYAPRPGMAGLARWAPRPPLPELLPGEDRSFGSGLFVDLVPASCWFTNVRSGVAAADWDRVRRMVYRRGGRPLRGLRPPRGPQVQLEAHERWYFDDARGVQVLRRLVCLCPLCHLASHYGRAATVGATGPGLICSCCGSRAWIRRRRTGTSNRRSPCGNSGPRAHGTWI